MQETQTQTRYLDLLSINICISLQRLGRFLQDVTNEGENRYIHLAESSSAKEISCNYCVCVRYCNNWMPRIIIRDKTLGASEVVYKEKSWPDLTSLFSSLRSHPKKELEPITRMPLFTWNVHHNKNYPSFKKNDCSKPRLPSAFCLSSSACLSFFFKAWLCTSVKQVETCQCWKVATYHMVPNNIQQLSGCQCQRICRPAGVFCGCSCDTSCDSFSFTYRLLLWRIFVFAALLPPALHIFTIV